MTLDRIYRLTGGRKMFAQHVAVVLLTAMALVLRPPFLDYALGLCAALGITVGSIAWEDVRRRAAHDDGEPLAGYRRPAGWQAEPAPEVDEP